MQGATTLGVGTFDYVIVGAGSAGCVLANRLSADGRYKVLLWRPVRKTTISWIHIPIGYGKTMFHKAYNWGFYTDPEANMHGRKIYWPRGRGLGGSSSINGLISIRGQSDDYDGRNSETPAGTGTTFFPISSGLNTTARERYARW